MGFPNLLAQPCFEGLSEGQQDRGQPYDSKYQILGTNKRKIVPSCLAYKLSRNIWPAIAITLQLIQPLIQKAFPFSLFLDLFLPSPLPFSEPKQILPNVCVIEGKKLTKMKSCQRGQINGGGVEAGLCEVGREALLA